MYDLRSLARALGGDVRGNSVSAPGPGHSPKDRSLSVTPSAAAPDGFIVHSFAGNDFAECRDHVRGRLGLPTEYSPRTPRIERKSSPPLRPQPPPSIVQTQPSLARRMWREGVQPRGSVVERYLNSRGLELNEGLAGEVIRYHRPANAMLALFRDIVSDEPKAISRTFLTPEGAKIERKFLGPVGGCAIKLDPEEEVLGGLHIGEGIETCLSARQGVRIGDDIIPLRPTWALGSAGAIATFPILVAMECLTLIREKDDANTRAAVKCGVRWQTTRREVRNVWPDAGKDLNDELRARR